MATGRSRPGRRLFTVPSICRECPAVISGFPGSPNDFGL